MAVIWPRVPGSCRTVGYEDEREPRGVERERERIAALPDLPTAAEGGLPGFEVSVWHGLYAPKGTPADAQARAIEVYEDHGFTRWGELPSYAKIDGKPAAYVCAGETCSLPLTEAAALTAELVRVRAA